MSGKQGEWWMITVCGGVCMEECLGYSSWDKHLTLMSYHSCELSWLYEALLKVEFCLWPSLQFKGSKGGKFLFFPFFLGLSPFIK